MATKLMMMVATMVTSMTSMAADFLMDGRDGVWEIACSPHSWLSQACDQQGLNPRRINLSSGYDLYRRETWEHLRVLRRRHRPRRLWFSLPCTKWCRWSSLNYASPERQELLASYRRRERRMLWQAVRFIEESIVEDPYMDIFFEWPYPCVGWQEPALQHLASFLESHGRDWLPCRIDGCVFGLRERDGEGDFLRKQWMVRTTSPHFHKKFRARVCPGGHAHSYIQGIETAKSAYYPWRLVKSIAMAWRQELISDRNHRLLFATEDVPAMMSLEEELFAAEEQHWGLPALQDQGSSSALHPAEPQPMELELKQWKARLDHFHRAAGHPTSCNLARLVKDSGSPAWKVQAALEHKCQTCQSLKLGSKSSGQVPPAATHSLCKAWEAIGLDTAEWTIPGQRQKCKFLLMIDLATKLRVAVLLKVYPELSTQAESADEVIRALSMAWLAQYPKPKMIVADNAKSFISNRFHEFMMEQNILLHFPPEKEPWSHGIVEAAIQDVKHVATAIQTESMENKPEVTLALTTSALNSTEYTAGFSSHQWAFGAKFSISDEDVRLWRAVDPALDFVNVSQARLAAEEIARRSRARRVLSKLTNTTVKQPLRSYKPTELVMVWRQVQVGEQHQGPRGGHKKSGRPHWAGPGRVVFAEAVPHQDEGDDRQHILWILVGRKLWRCSVHSVRPVTESERLHYELTSGEDPSSWKTLQDVLPRREYVDITSEVPGPEDRELPDLPPEPDGTTYAPIRRAIGKSTLRPEDYKKVHRIISDRTRSTEASTSSKISTRSCSSTRRCKLLVFTDTSTEGLRR